MTNHQSAKTFRCLTAAFALGLLSIQPMSVVAEGRGESNHGNFGYDHGKKAKRIQGTVVTGVNSVRGKPFFTWGEEPYGSFNFPTTFVYNEHGTTPLLIDEHTPDSAVLATGVSPDYLLIRGDPPSVVKPEWINVPLRKVPVNVDFDPSLTKKQVLRGIREAEPLELSQMEPASDITLGQWMQASGVLTVNCLGKGADLRLRVKNLTPNRIYSVWATMQLAEPASGSYSLTLPVGGTPSIFMTDDRGDATYNRWIKFCPLDKQSTSSSMLTIELLYHANQSTYGAIPAPGLMLGLITFPHILFPINVDLLPTADAR